MLLRGSAFLVSTFRRGSEREGEKVGKERVEREREEGRKINHQQKTGYSVFKQKHAYYTMGDKIKRVHNFINTRFTDSENIKWRVCGLLQNLFAVDFVILDLQHLRHIFNRLEYNKSKPCR